MGCAQFLKKVTYEYTVVTETNDVMYRSTYGYPHVIHMFLDQTNSNNCSTPSEEKKNNQHPRTTPVWLAYTPAFPGDRSNGMHSCADERHHVQQGLVHGANELEETMKLHTSLGGPATGFCADSPLRCCVWILKDVSANKNKGLGLRSVHSKVG